MVQNRKKKSFFSLKKLISAIIIVLIIGAGFYYVSNHNKNKTTAVAGSTNTNASLVKHSSQPYPAPTTQDTAANDARKADPSSAATTLDNGSTATTSTTSPSSVSVLVTRASVVSGALEVGTQVSGATAGTCTLTATQSGASPVTKSNAVVAQNNAYVCPVFSLPTSDFPNQGSWDVSVSVNDNGSTASNDWGQVDLSN
jgi:cytoskeletal protein RodZ